MHTSIQRILGATLAAAAMCLAACGASRQAQQVAHGAQLARALGCSDCHSPDFAGHKVSRNDAVAVLYSSNLTQALQHYSDAEFRRVLTTGVRPDGTRLWYMDAAPYAVLSDEDLRDLQAFLRTLKPAGAAHPRIKTTPTFDELVRTGAIRPESATLAQDLANPPQPTKPAHERGRYLARAYCAGCHAPSLRGFTPPQPGDPPDLAVAAAYTRAEFHTLIHEGRAPQGRDLKDMADAARKRFAALPAEDIDALYDYLTTWTQTRRQ